MTTLQQLDSGKLRAHQTCRIAREFALAVTADQVSLHHSALQHALVVARRQQVRAACGRNDTGSPP